MRRDVFSPGKTEALLGRVLRHLDLTVVLIHDYNNSVCSRRFSDVIPCHFVCFVLFRVHVCILLFIQLFQFSSEMHLSGTSFLRCFTFGQYFTGLLPSVHKISCLMVKIIC